MSQFVRITKAQARKRYENNETFAMCPSNMRPGFPYAMHSTIFPETYKPKGYPELWYSFESMYNNWAYYNTSHETGYYAHYYTETEV